MPPMPEPRLVICNATPIIALALVQQVSLLKELYGEVWIPPAVRAEILAGGTKAGAAEVQSASYICTVTLDDPERADLLSDLDRGEAEVIALAQERSADLVIIDERLGRRHARRLGMQITGVLGILLRAKERGYIQAVRPYVEQMKQGGIRLSEALMVECFRLAGE